LTNEREFEPGDIVYLISGSSKMTVVEVDYLTCRVMWNPFGSSEIKTLDLPKIALRLHNK
jgi:hypothetical protein